MSQQNFVKREVYGYWFKGDDTPLVGEQIVFEPTEDLGYTGGNFVARRRIPAAVGADGRFSAMLWCDETSDVPVDWQVQFPGDPDAAADEDGEKELPEPLTFSLVYGDGAPLGLDTALQLSIEPPSDVALLYQAIYQYVQTLLTGGIVLETILNGLSLASSAAITAQDTVIAAFGKLQKQLNNYGIRAGNSETAIEGLQNNSNQTNQRVLATEQTNATQDSQITTVTGGLTTLTETVGSNKTLAHSESEAARIDAITTVRGGASPGYDTLKKVQDYIAAINAIIGSDAPDADAFVSNVKELLIAFQTFPEGVDIATALAAKINISDIANNLSTVAAGKVLDARQGKILNDALTTLNSSVAAAETAISNLQTASTASNNRITATEQQNIAQDNALVNLTQTVAGNQTSDRAYTDAAKESAINTLRDGVSANYDTLNKIGAYITAINAIIGSDTPDADAFVTTVKELLLAFQSFPEGVDIATALAGKVNTADIANSLAIVAAGKVLDARQGKILSDAIAAINAVLPLKADLVGGKVPAAQLPNAFVPFVTIAGQFANIQTVNNQIPFTALSGTAANIPL